MNYPQSAYMHSNTFIIPTHLSGTLGRSVREMVLFANISRFVQYADTPTERPDKLGFKMFVNIQLYPNRSLDRSNVLFSNYSKALRLSCPLLPASCSPPCLDVARYAFCKSKSNTQDMSGQSTQSLMTDLG